MENQTKILIVDDEENIRIALSFLLKTEDYLVEEAVNGQDAIEKYKSFQPDIILMDVMMPLMNGVEAAKYIREMDTLSNTMIIFLTAKGTTQDRMTGFMAGGDDYVIKPFENEKILQKIKEIAN